jgi:hypothetical protein
MKNHELTLGDLSSASTSGLKKAMEIMPQSVFDKSRGMCQQLAVRNLCRTPDVFD